MFNERQAGVTFLFIYHVERFPELLSTKYIYFFRLVVCCDIQWFNSGELDLNPYDLAVCLQLLLFSCDNIILNKDKDHPPLVVESV